MAVYPRLLDFPFHLRSYSASVKIQEPFKLNIRVGSIEMKIHLKPGEFLDNILFWEMIRANDPPDARKEIIRLFWHHYLQRECGLLDASKIRFTAWWLMNFYGGPRYLPPEIEVELEEISSAERQELWQYLRAIFPFLRRLTERPTPSALLTHKK